MKFLNRQIFTSRPLLETVSTKDPIIIRFAPWNHLISAGRSARYRLTNGSQMAQSAHAARKHITTMMTSIVK